MTHMTRLLTESEIDARLSAADRAVNVKDLSQAMVDMMTLDPTLEFSTFETRLRALRSTTFLIARPKGHEPRWVRVLDRHGGPCEFYLWICLHGEAEQAKMLADYNLTPAQNLANLQHCGCLVVEG